MQSATFLLVDDDAIAIMALKRALKKLNITNEILVANDGRQALEILETAALAAGGPLPPFIVTLDMNMPRMNGSEFLAEIAKHPALTSAIVLAFASPSSATSCDPEKHFISGHLCKDDTKETLGCSLANLEQRAALLEYSL